MRFCLRDSFLSDAWRFIASLMTSTKTEKNLSKFFSSEFDKSFNSLSSDALRSLLKFSLMNSLSDRV